MTALANGVTAAAATVSQWIQAHAADIRGWRRHIHANPELGHAEHRTTAYVVDVLSRAGLNPRVLPAGTGVVCDIGQGPRTVALRADLDALPVRERTGAEYASTVDGVMHACGHDAHVAALLGAGVALHSLGDALSGRVRLIFQPAEEVMTGALEVIEAGVLEDVDEIFMLHTSPDLPVGHIGSRAGALTSSSDAITVSVDSPGGHTSRPHLTGDLIYALAGLAHGLPGLLSRRIDPQHVPILVWGRINAGHAANAIPRTGELTGTLRLKSREAWDIAPELITELVDALLSGTRVSYELGYQRGVPPVVNTEASVARVRQAVAAELGADSYVELPQGPAGEDFAYYLDHVPGAMAVFGIWDGSSPKPAIHTDRYDIDERALPIAARTYARMALTSLIGA